MQVELTRPAPGAGQALWMSTFAFTACFAVWTIFSIIGVQIKADLGLSETQFGLLVGTPILTGSVIRLVLGVLADQYGGRFVNLIVMLAAGCGGDPEASPSASTGVTPTSSTTGATQPGSTTGSGSTAPSASASRSRGRARTSSR